jgi:hypothetical protein
LRVAVWTGDTRDTRPNSDMRVAPRDHFHATPIPMFFLRATQCLTLSQVTLAQSNA